MDFGFLARHHADPYAPWGESLVRAETRTETRVFDRRRLSPIPHSDPSPTALYPIPGVAHAVLLRPLPAAHPEVTEVAVGDCSDYTDFDDPLRFFARNVRYHFGVSGARLVIGKYCALAHGVTFIITDANHAAGGPSTFPIFGGSWAEAMPMADMPWLRKGDTVVGNDAWLGFESLVLPGVRVGHGAIIAARAVVSRDVPDYAVAAGNPARVVRRRFDVDTARRLVAMAWWDWPPEAVWRAIPLLVKGDVGGLEAFAAGIGGG